MRLFSAASKKLPALAVVLAVAAGVLWWQRAPLLSWYYLRGLAAAEESTRAAWVECVIGLDDDAVPGLIELLRHGDARVCANGEAALSALAKRWGAGDAKTAALAEELTGRFQSLSTPGREATLEWYLAVLHDPSGHKTASQALTVAAGKLLPDAAKIEEKGVRVRTLALAEVLLGNGAVATADLCRTLATQGMTSPDADICARAIRLVMHAPLHAEKALLDQAVAFLKNTSPEVRRAAVLAVGLAEETIGVQEMLPLLHDADAEVRRLCEQALLSRGLQPSHVEKARLISHPRAGQRLRVFGKLDDGDDLDLAMWLQHLSQDSSPAVRGAAIRFAAEDPGLTDFQQRMQQMLREDPSPTVRQLAAYYLKAYQHR